MVMKKTAQASVLLLSLIASQAHAFDLLEAWQAARAYDPQFASARADAEAGRTKSLQALALKSPQVTLNTGVAGMNSDNKINNAQFSNAQFAGSSGASGTTDFRTRTDAGLNLNLNLRAEYPLYDAARNGSATQLNKQAQLAEVQLTLGEQQLMQRVAQTYFDTLLAADTLKTLIAQQAAVTEALASAKARFKEGDVAIIDTHETQARYDLLASQVLEAESNLQLTRAALADMTGNQDAALVSLPQKARLASFASGDLQSWLARAQSSHPLVHAQQLQQEIAHTESGKFQAKYSPVLNLVALAGGEHLQGLGGNDANVTNRQLSLGVQLTIPLYSGGMRDARYQEALALEEKSRNQTEFVRQQAAREARSAWLAVTVGQGQVKALEQAERSAEIKLDSTRVGRDVGDRTTLDVLNSEQELYNTRLALYRSRYQVLLALLNLSAAAGELGELRLQEINHILTERYF
ncbi:MAG: TolC family outer membrane protein [Methylotenera sp.]|nr:TolC family outer membrane protein [Methylotenera sp.]MDP1958483.1 TolC family outer membrane protein [Methylotenera sp.]MDP3942955.1 TolC family outer membrane protein [Methylotenera sp.]